MKVMKAVFAGLLVMLASSAAVAQVVVNIDSRVSGTVDATTLYNPVVVPLAAGSYVAVPFDNSGTPGGFTAWNAWGTTATGCDTAGANCTTGWLNNYRVKVPGQPMKSAGVGNWATPALALANAMSISFTLTTAGSVEFAVTDNGAYLYDNAGGISLRILPVDTTPREIPTLDRGIMLLLTLLLAGGTVLALRRRQ